MAVGARGFGGGLVAHHFEELQAGAQRLADQQFESSFGGFEFIALKLHLLDAIQQIAAGGIVQPVFQAMLLQFVKHAAAARKIAQQDALAVADDVGIDVLVSSGILQHRADVDAAFMGKGAVTYVRLIVAHAEDSPARR